MINLLLLRVLSALQPDESTSFKVLHGSFVFLGCSFCLKGAEIPSLPVFGFFFREYNRNPPDLSFLIIEDLSRAKNSP